MTIEEIRKNAPSGATKYCKSYDEDEDFDYFKIDGDVCFIWNGHSFSVWCTVNEDKYMNELKPL